jgi:hypothetical protein
VEQEEVALKVRLDQQDLLVRRERKERQELLLHKVQLVLKVYKAHKVCTVYKDLALKELRVCKAHKD